LEPPLRDFEPLYLIFGCFVLISWCWIKNWTWFYSKRHLSGRLSGRLSGLSRLKGEKIKRARELSKYFENKSQARSKYLKQSRARLSFLLAAPDTAC